MKRALLSLLVLSLAVPLLAQDADVVPPLPAAAIVNAACVKAKAEGKTVFVIFHASWCGWCKTMDKMLASETIQPVWDKSVVTIHLTVMENEANKGLENPGGDMWLEKLGGKGQGIPYTAFLDGDGKVLVTSDREDAAGAKQGNIGHPAKPEEIAWFEHMLKVGTKMSASDRGVVSKFLKAQDLGG
ncbi:MAG: thioredoxin family protein [Fimbriimonadaceae bacterium]